MVIDNKLPLIKKSYETNKMFCGFRDLETDEFECDIICDLTDDEQIDVFMEKYNLSIVMIENID